MTRALLPPDALPWFRVPGVCCGLALAALFAVVGGVFPSPVGAQSGFELSRQPLQPTTDGVFLPTADTLGHLGWSVSVGLGYAHRPLLVSRLLGDERNEEAAIVGSSVEGSAVAALGVGDWLQLWVGLPFTLARGGDDASGLPAPELDRAREAGIGDFRIGASARLVGDASAEGLRLAARGELGVPSGSQESLLGDGGAHGTLMTLLAYRTRHVEPIAHLGVRLRPERVYLVGAVGHELTFGLGSRFFFEPIALELALQGSTTLVGDRAFTSQTSPLEVRLGAQGALEVLRFGVGLGVGLTDGVGTPQVRGLLTLGVQLPGEAAEASGETARRSAVDEDEDDDPADQSADGDGDGVEDGADFCPAEPESVNGFLDDDGCPDGTLRTESHLVVTPGLLFDENSAELDVRTRQALDLVAVELRDPSVRFVQVEGYAAEGEPDPLGLSERRAEAVQDYLLTRGVDPERLTAVGVGDGLPVEGATRPANRRVELRLIDF